jgi:hypothetical protein
MRSRSIRSFQAAGLSGMVKTKGFLRSHPRACQLDLPSG